MLKTILAASVLGFSSLASAGLITSLGYEKSEVLDKEGVTVQVGAEVNNLRLSANSFVDVKDRNLNSLQSYGGSINAVVPFGQYVELTPGIGYDHYKSLDKGKFNFNVGADLKLTDKLLIGAKIKENINNDVTDSGTTYQGTVTYKW